MSEFTVDTGDWPKLGADATLVRDAVFVREQRIAAPHEWDDADLEALHVVAYRASERGRHPVGTGRLLPDGAIGRLAVLEDARRRGIGSHMLRTLIARAAGRGDAAVWLYSQSPVVPFYERHGFTKVGDPFEEAGVEHVEMRRILVVPPESGGGATNGR